MELKAKILPDRKGLGGRGLLCSTPEMEEPRCQAAEPRPRK